MQNQNENIDFSRLANYGFGSGIGGLLGSLFFKDPSTQANKIIGDMESRTGQYLNPYMQQGLSSMGDLGGQYNSLTHDPTGMLAKFGSQYKESPGFQNQLRQALAASGHAAAAGGMAGSPQHEQQNMQLGSDIASQDYNNYMNQALGLYGQGLQGQQNLTGLGFGASQSMADNIAQQLAQQAAYKYQGQSGKNSMWSNLLGGLGGLAGLKFL